MLAKEIGPIIFTMVFLTLTCIEFRLICKYLTCDITLQIQQNSMYKIEVRYEH